MGLFYPSMFGIVGQKMTSLQYRSQGDPEDPHDEHYLMATQSKQDQVTHIFDHPPVYTIIIIHHHHYHQRFSLSDSLKI